MSDHPALADKRRQQDLAFFGRIMANVSHEFNNVITVIGELSGLLQDLSMLAERGRPIEPEKLKKVTGNIERHVARGKELISNMNRLSHSVDAPLADFDLGEAATNMQVLAQRLIDRRRAGFQAERVSDDLRLTADPFTVRHALFTALDLAMDSPSDTPEIALKLSQNGGDLTVSVSVDEAPEAVESTEKFEKLTDLLQRLGGGAELSRAGAAARFDLRIPKQTDRT